MKVKPTYDIECPYCGTPFRARRDSLLERRIKSCGCFQKAMGRKQGLANKVHGHTRTRNGIRWVSKTYISWRNMLSRCENPKSKDYKNYGGRGIMVCSAWHWYPYFLEDMGRRPTGRSLDRINNDGHYERTNCRWATSVQQNNNRRNVL